MSPQATMRELRAPSSRRVSRLRGPNAKENPHATEAHRPVARPRRRYLADAPHSARRRIPARLRRPRAGGNAEADGRGRAGGHHAAADGLLPGRLDPGGPGGDGREHPVVRQRARPAARGPQARAGRRRAVRDPGRAAGGRRESGERPRLRPHVGAALRLAHALGPGRVRQQPDLQHGGTVPGDDLRPPELLQVLQPRPPGRPALHVHGQPDRGGGATRGHRSRAGRGGLGCDAADRADPEPVDGGAPGQPRRHRARLRRRQTRHGSGRGRPHDRPERRRPARGQAQAAAREAAAADSDRRVVELRRPRHGRPLGVPGLLG